MCHTFASVSRFKAPGKTSVLTHPEFSLTFAQLWKIYLFITFMKATSRNENVLRIFQTLSALTYLKTPFTLSNFPLKLWPLRIPQRHIYVQSKSGLCHWRVFIQVASDKVCSIFLGMYHSSNQEKPKPWCQGDINTGKTMIRFFCFIDEMQRFPYVCYNLLSLHCNEALLIDSKSDTQCFNESNVRTCMLTECSFAQEQCHALLA